MADHAEPAGAHRGGAFGWWTGTPLYLRILGALVLGILLALAVGPIPGGKEFLAGLELPARLILRLLGALAPPLILFAIVHALMTAELRGRATVRLAGLLLLNTLVAILVGLGVANVLRPGQHARLEPATSERAAQQSADPLAESVTEILEKNGYKPAPPPKDALTAFLDNVPDSLLRPLVENNRTLGVIFVAVAFGIALRRYRRRKIETVEDLVELGFQSLLVVLHWIIQLVPLGVFGIVASIVGKEGFAPFLALGSFIGAVLLALTIQAAWYLSRIALGSWVRPFQLLRGGRDALVMAFSTASSTATMPVTYECLRTRVGLREESASMGALVGANFNNDGTALYEAMSALFVSQMLGQHLDLGQQVLVVLTSVIASVGAAGIPEAGLVTMTLVFTAVGLPPKYIAILITVDWFLDRCRTAINVMGDMNVSCLLDGKQRPAGASPEETDALPTPDPGGLH